MRILFVAGYLPAPPTFGAARRVHGLITNLANSHSVSVLALVEQGFDCQVKIRATRELCEDVVAVENDRTGVAPRAKRRLQLRSLLSTESYERQTYRRPAMQVALDELLARGRFDLVNVESVHMGAYVFPEGVPVVLDEHNIEYELLSRSAAAAGSMPRRVYSALDARKLRSEEERLWRCVDGCAVTSDREEALVRRAAPVTPTAVVPNAVDTLFFTPGDQSPHEDRILFFGALNYHPNADALSFFIERVMPLLRRRSKPPTLIVVGPSASPFIRALAAPDIVIVGEVPDIRTEIERAAVVVAPLRVAGGTRLKILEAMAMARPVVSTTVGAEGLAAVDGRELILADDPAAFAVAVSRLLDDADLRRMLGDAGRRLVEARYDWRASTMRLERLYRTVLGSARRVGGARLAHADLAGD